MNKIFFSYTLHDGSINKRFLINLKKWVSSQKMSCYIDVLENGYNEEGFQEKLIEEMKKCNIFCKIDSKDYMKSKWTQGELKQANNFGLDMFSTNIVDLKHAVNNNLDINKYLAGLRIETNSINSI